MAGRLPQCAALAAVTAFVAVAYRAPSPAAADSVVFSLVTTGVSQPTDIQNADDERLFIVTKSGRIRVWDGSVLLPTPFLDLAGQISTTNEDGLLGLAFHPEYETNGRFFIDYVNLDGDVVVAEYAVSGDPNVADPTGSIVLVIPHQAHTAHNGGQIAFGPDGYLYIAVGDGGTGGAPAQDATDLLGSVLRIDVDGGAPYAVPPDNPFVAPHPGRDEIWAIGLRNPWRMSFDPLTGDLFIADVGEQKREEVNVQPATSTGGENYGWRIMEGSICFSPPVGCDMSGLTLPDIEYEHTDGNCSVTGGYMYRGPDALLDGKYVYGDFCSGRIWAAARTESGWVSALLADTPYRISTFGRGGDGSLYVADYIGGAVYRIDTIDSDGDGVPDAVDNCPDVYNPGQANADGNFIRMNPPFAFNDLTWINADDFGDACDDDADNDGIENDDELAIGPGHPLCPAASGPTDPTQRDTDGDRVLDGAECAMGSDPTDFDSRPTVMDCADHLGVTLATDSDGDGIPDYIEFCHYGSDRFSTNTDGDGCGDLRSVASLNASLAVTAADIGIAASLLGSYGSESYLPDKVHLWNADVDKNGSITAADLGRIASALGSCP